MMASLPTHPITPRMTPSGMAPGLRPVRSKRTEVSDAKQVHARELMVHTRAPERETVVTHDAPVVEGVAPELARLRKIIRWHTGDSSRTPFAIELELLGMCPGLR